MQPLCEHGLRLSRAHFPVTRWLRRESVAKQQSSKPGFSGPSQQRCQYSNRSLGGDWHSARVLPNATRRSQLAAFYGHTKGNKQYIRQSSSLKPQEPSSSTSQNGFPQRELPSQSEHRRSPLSKRASHLMDNLQSNIFIAGQRLNDLTGYSGIEALKQDIENQEAQVESTRTALQTAKDDYTKSISQRSASQREVNELLQRKHAWSPSDLERFTALYRSDHANEVAETTAQANLAAAERAAEEAANRLSSSILKRYHEEQIWSDKIRRMSTWGTWGLMGVNVLLFLVFQWALEPWRRGRLVRGFEEKVKAVLESEKDRERERAVLAEVVRPVGIPSATVEGSRTEQGIDESIAAAVRPVEDVSERMVVPKVEATDEALPLSVTDTLSDTELATPINLSFSHPSEALSTLFYSSRSATRRLFSTNLISIRQVDLMSARIEGAVFGIAFASIVAALVRAAR